MKKVVWRTPWNYDSNIASVQHGYVESMPSLTVQEHTLDTDINVIVQRFGLTGTMPVNHRVPQYGDYSQIHDYRTAIEAVQAAQDHFMEMPHEVRSRFQNDPQLFLDYCSNPANMDGMRQLGLAIPKESQPVGGPAVDTKGEKS